MSRPILAACAVLLGSLSVRAADPKPLWEVEAAAGERATAPGWLAFSPNGKAVAAVIVREGASDPREFTYKLRVWDAGSRKERFAAEIGRGKTPTWNDELASFPSDDTILTGGQSLTVRNLENGNQTSARGIIGVGDHTVWAVPDLGDTYYLRREPDREGKPIELHYRSATNQLNDFRTSRVRPETESKQAEILPPRPGLRPQAIAMNPGRSRLVASFRDESPLTVKPRHSLVLYRIKTVTEFDLDDVAEATNPHAGTVSAMTFARDGKTLATGGEDGSVCLWNVENIGSTWKPRATVTGANGRVAAIAFSPDWRLVAAVTWDKAKPNVLLIDADTGVLLRSARLDRELTAVAWSPDGRTLLTGGYSGKLCAWDVEKLLKGN